MGINLTTFYLVLLFLCCLNGAAKFRNLATPFKILLFQCLYTLIIEVIGFYLESLAISKTPLYYLTLAVLIAFNGAVFYTLSKGKRVLRFFAITTFLALLLHLFFTIKVENLNQFPNKGMVIQGLVIVVFCLAFYYQKLKTPEAKPILKQDWFWFTTGNLIFYSSTFFIFTTLGLIESIGNWAYHLIFITNLMLYCCYFMALYFNKKETSYD